MKSLYRHKKQAITYGTDNAHPLSKMTTELVWEGKYDEYDNRRQVDIAGCAMPMQKIETIDEPRSQALAKGKIDLFEKEYVLMIFGIGRYRRYCRIVYRDRFGGYNQ